MKTCAACATTTGPFMGIGGCLICAKCEPEIHAKITELRENGKPVNVRHIAHALFKENHSAGNYLLRDIPENIWNKAQQESANSGKSLRDIILESLREYLGD